MRAILPVLCTLAHLYHGVDEITSPGSALRKPILALRERTYQSIWPSFEWAVQRKVLRWCFILCWVLRNLELISPMLLYLTYILNLWRLTNKRLSLYGRCWSSSVPLTKEWWLVAIIFNEHIDTLARIKPKVMNLQKAASHRFATTE